MRKTLLSVAIFIATVFSCSQAVRGETAMPDQTPHCELVGDALVNTTPGSITFITRIDDNGKITRDLYTAPESAEMIRARENYLKGAQTYTLKVSSSADKNGQNQAPDVIFVMKDLDLYWKVEKQAEGTFELPAGVYNIQVVYSDYDHSSVYFPNVELNGDKTVAVNADMADKLVSFNILMPDGNPIVLPTRDNPEAPHNVDQIACMQYVLTNGACQWFHSITSSVGGNEVYKTFTIKSNFGPDTRICWNALTWKTDFGHIGYAVTHLGNNVTNGQKIENKVSDYYQIGAKFQHTPLYDTKGQNNTVIQMGINLCRPDGHTLSGFALNITNPGKFLVCSPKLDTTDYHSMTYLQAYEVYPKYGRKLGIYSPAIANTDKGIMFLCNQENNSLYNIGAKPDNADAPINPLFSFLMDTTYVMASTTPYANIGAKVAKTGEKQYLTYNVGGYYGNYGENRFVDTQYYDEEATYGGEPVSLASFRDVNAWLASLAAKETPENADITVSFINNNTKVDDIVGKNVCTLSFKEGDMNAVPPTVQRLMFKNKSGIPTVRFQSPADGTLTIAGGVFKPVDNNVSFGAYSKDIVTWNYAPATIKVECAPNGTERYEEIAMTENAQKYVLNYGTVWEGSLASYKHHSSNGWFDLKVTLSDGKGNTQVQTLAPAFYVQSLMGVGEIAHDKDSFYVENGQILSSQGSDVTVFDLTGAKVANSGLAKGIYIAVSGGKTAKIFVK